MIVFLHASTNNRADTVLQLFTEATTTYNIPSRVRSDQGLENIEVGRFIIHMRGINRGSIITGNSVHNQRIERLWREVNRVVVSRFLNIFLFLESNGAFNPDDEMHLFCLHVVYMPLINSALQELTEQWNNHPLSSETNYSPRQLWVQGMLELRNSNLTAVRDVVNNEPEIENLDEVLKKTDLFQICILNHYQCQNHLFTYQRKTREHFSMQLQQYLSMTMGFPHMLHH